jgi:hypothetical protein
MKRAGNQIPGSLVGPVSLELQFRLRCVFFRLFYTSISVLLSYAWPDSGPPYKGGLRGKRPINSDSAIGEKKVPLSIAIWMYWKKKQVYKAVSKVDSPDDVL